MKRYISTIVIFLLAATQLHAQNIKRPDTYYYNRGLECLAEGKQADAYDYFTNEVNDNPKNGYAYLWMGYILYTNELYGDGMAMLDKAQKNIPSKDKEFVSMLYQMKGDLYLGLDEFDNALSNYTSAIKADSQNRDAYKDRADLYYVLERYDLSNKDYDKMIELEPSDYYGYMGKGRNANAQKKYDEAIKQFDYVIKLHGKDYYQCYAFRAEAFIGLGQYEKAADDIVLALDSDGHEKAFYLMQTVMADSALMTMVSKLKIQQLKEPNRALWPYYMGIVYEASENYSKAIENYGKANSIDFSDVTSNRISNCYGELGDYPMALQYVEEAIAMNPEGLRYKLNKADLEYESGAFNDAISTIGTCIEATPDYYYLYYRKGFYEDNALLIDDAIEDYSTSILLDPDYYYAFLGRGDMYMKKGMTKEAMADYRQVVAKDTVPSTGSCAQYAFLALGEKDKAVAYNQRILDSYPNDKGCYYDAACLYSRMGETERALEYLREAFEHGYHRFAHLELDDDLEPLRKTTAYQKMVAEYKAKIQYAESPTMNNQEETIVEIPFTKSNGVTEVQCNINGLPLHFVFDTGASDVTMSMVEATFMLKNKYLSPLDIVGKQNYLTADGNVSEGTIINLKSVKIGDLELTNVRASVVKSQNAPLLLGQSVLGRLGKIEIDNEKRVIKVSDKRY